MFWIPFAQNQETERWTYWNLVVRINLIHSLYGLDINAKWFNEYMNNMGTSLVIEFERSMLTRGCGWQLCPKFCNLNPHVFTLLSLLSDLFFNYLCNHLLLFACSFIYSFNFCFLLVYAVWFFSYSGAYQGWIRCTCRSPQRLVIVIQLV